MNRLEVTSDSTLILGSSMARRTTEELEKLETELKMLFDARSTANKGGNIDQEAFRKRVGQLYLFGSISEATFRISEFLYGNETACTKTEIQYRDSSNGGGNGRC